MTTRLLPPTEWDKLAGTPLGAVRGKVNPDVFKIVVVEDDDGTLLGCWGLTPVLHAEGVWVRESERKRGAVQRRLLNGMRELVAEAGAGGVWTGAEDETVAALIERLGGQAIPFRSFFLPLYGRA